MDAVSYAHSAKQAKRITDLIRVGELEPASVELGTEWYVPTTGKTYKRINDGSNDVWVDINSSGANAAIKQSEEFIVGTASGNYDGISLNTFPTQYGYYTDYVLVALNGKLLAKDDFTATDGYNVVLTEDAVNGDIVEVIAFGTFVVADHYTKSEIDTGNIVLNAIKNVDGAGSGLDADLLDGLDSSEFAKLNGNNTQSFKVASAVNGDEAMAFKQLRGYVLPFAVSTVPTGFLECNGAELSRTTYADLYAVIGDTYGADDGSTTFNIPDLRGEFIRGWDNGRGADGDRVIGSSQLDDFKAHNHTLTGNGVGRPNTNSGTTLNNEDRGSKGQNLSTYFPISQTGGTETRPRNIAMMYCIKY